MLRPYGPSSSVQVLQCGFYKVNTAYDDADDADDDDDVHIRN
jgi:hypothetical protein